MAHTGNLHSAPVESVINAETFTSKDRLKVSNIQTTFFSSFQFGKDVLWDESTANGGTAIWNATQATVDLTVTSTLNSEVSYQSKNVMRYIPGRNSGLAGAYKLSPLTTGIRTRYGIFAPSDGAYFETDGTEMYCVVRTSSSGSIVENRVPRSLWNGDKLDGNGRSEIDIDLTKQQLIYIEYEWYGAGEVKYYFVIDGRKRLIHTTSHANHISVPWSSTPFLPIRMEIKNTGGVAGTHTIHVGSTSHLSEGSSEYEGAVNSLTTPIGGISTTSANTFYPILNFRLKSDSLRAVVVPLSFQVATLDNTSVFYKILKNPTLTGASWADTINPEPVTQYDFSSTAFSGGVEVYSGFAITAGAAPIIFDKGVNTQIGRTSMGTASDIFTIVAATTNANKKVVASINWLEQR
jgi:hypothetical protein